QIVHHVCDLCSGLSVLDCDSFLLPEQVGELRACPVGGGRGGRTAAAKLEVLAEIPDLLVHLALRLRLAALGVMGRIVNRAIQAAVQIGTAVQTRVAASDPHERTDITSTMVTQALVGG